MTSILLVDDERDLVWSVRHSLVAEGYEVLTAYDGVEALAVAFRHLPNLIILDILMPGLDGLQVCQRLRRTSALAAVPILFLTTRGTVEDRIVGLETGGDDYLGKPFDLGELKARIKALLRRTLPVQQASSGTGDLGPMITAGDLTLDLRTDQVHVGSDAVQLTSTESELLHYLMTHPDTVFSSRCLLQQVWGYSPGTASPGLVRWHVKNLRAKVESDPSNPTLICTVPRHGYVLTF